MRTKDNKIIKIYWCCYLGMYLFFWIFSPPRLLFIFKLYTKLVPAFLLCSQGHLGDYDEKSCLKRPCSALVTADTKEKLKIETLCKK